MANWILTTLYACWPWLIGLVFSALLYGLHRLTTLYSSCGGLPYPQLKRQQWFRRQRYLRALQQPGRRPPRPSRALRSAGLAVAIDAKTIRPGPIAASAPAVTPSISGWSPAGPASEGTVSSSREMRGGGVASTPAAPPWRPVPSTSGPRIARKPTPSYRRATPSVSPGSRISWSAHGNPE